MWREQRDAARAAGKPFKKSIEDVEKEYVLSERGGQVRRDIERLSESDSGLVRIQVAGQAVRVRMSPTKTKFFGVLPRDVRAATIERQLKESGFAHEILGVDIKSSTLKEIAAKLKPLAEKLAEAAP